MDYLRIKTGLVMYYTAE